MRRKFSPDQRLFIAERAAFLCEYCLSPEDFSPITFDIEHIVPLSQGGSNEFSNLAFACGTCNNHKYTHSSWKDPLTNTSVSLFNPRKDKWQDHFSWNSGFSHLKGLTPTGRATIELLKLNRPGLINLRKALLSFNVHPGNNR